MSQLELRNVSKVYESNGQSITGLQEVSFAFRPGSVTALLGRSGCGKTTLLNLAGAMDFPTSGEVLVDGRATSGLSDAELTALRRGRIGFIFQFFQLLPTLTVLENVELPLLLAGARDSARTALERLDWVGLKGRSGALPSQLSGGQQQRVAIARALVHRPSILVADEPTGNLDTATGNEIMALFERLHQEGNTIVLVTHEHDIAMHAHRIIHVRDGKVEKDEIVQH